MLILSCSDIDLLEDEDPDAEVRFVIPRRCFIRVALARVSSYGLSY